MRTRCESCKGRGWETTWVGHGPWSNPDGTVSMTCRDCNGHGTVDPDMTPQERSYWMNVEEV